MAAAPYDRSFWRFVDRLPVPAGLVPVSLGEGGTPLTRSRLLPDVGLYWKHEFRNPTGSHKDRALSLAAADAVRLGARTMAVVSAGSTGLSAAAYAARAGLRSVTLMGGSVPAERIAPVSALGSEIYLLDDGIDALIETLQQFAGHDGIYVASTTVRSNPVQALACRTIAYEIVEDLGRAPDWVIIPTGGGGTLASIAAGFRDLLDGGMIRTLPRLVAAVPDRFNALEVALGAGIRTWEDFARLPFTDDLDTVLGKLAHGHPPDGLHALAALDACNGMVVSCSEPDCLAAVGRIGGVDGLYLEPSSAIVAPALDLLCSRGLLGSGDLVVALACGSGFRETFTLLARSGPASVNRITMGEIPAVLGT